MLINCCSRAEHSVRDRVSLMTSHCDDVAVCRGVIGNGKSCRLRDGKLGWLGFEPVMVKYIKMQSINKNKFRVGEFEFEIYGSIPMKTKNFFKHGI
jgi:hypothetical protein